MAQASADVTSSRSAPVRRCSCHRRESASRLTAADFQAPFPAVSSSATTASSAGSSGRWRRKTTTGSPGAALADHCAHAVAAAGPRSRASGRGSSTRSRNHGPAGPDGESRRRARHRVGHLGDEIGRGVVAPPLCGSLTVTDLGARSVIAASQLRHAPVVTSSPAQMVLSPSTTAIPGATAPAVTDCVDAVEQPTAVPQITADPRRLVVKGLSRAKSCSTEHARFATRRPVR